ncbi:MAG TPA: FkbM family methyltransferase [Vicinamibacterales bacterium]|nr:FkbM family methyltransferase [Vicinamibacterales bacterium]
MRVIIDCAYLVRSRVPARSKIRILAEYLWLTLRVVLSTDSKRPGAVRLMRFTVRHFGIGSVQFLFREIFVRNEYTFQATSDRPVIFDCGANIGMATLFFKWLYPGCEIHAFEPDPETFLILSENVARNHLTDVSLHNVALVAKPGRLDLFVPAGPPGSPLMSTLSGRSTGACVRRLSVEGKPLSTYVGGGEVDFLKMDVEGAEEPVLRELASAGRLRKIKELAVEYHHNIEGSFGGCGSFLQLLSECGYQYQLDATWGNHDSFGTFQDILVRARREAQVVVHPGVLTTSTHAAV